MCVYVVGVVCVDVACLGVCVWVCVLCVLCVCMCLWCVCCVCMCVCCGCRSMKLIFCDVVKASYCKAGLTAYLSWAVASANQSAHF